MSSSSRPSPSPCSFPTWCCGCPSSCCRSRWGASRIRAERATGAREGGAVKAHAFVAVALFPVVAVAPMAHAQETPRMGGVLKVASIGEPPTLDIQATTTTLTYEIMWHVYEPL